MTVPFFYWVVLSSVEIPVSFCWGTASKQLSASYEPATIEPIYQG
jgi:hypothetical protein